MSRRDHNHAVGDDEETLLSIPGQYLVVADMVHFVVSGDGQICLWSLWQAQHCDVGDATV